MPKIWSYGQPIQDWQETAKILKTLSKPQRRPSKLIERLDDLEKQLKDRSKK